MVSDRCPLGYLLFFLMISDSLTPPTPLLKFTLISDSLGGHDVHDSTTVIDTFTPVDLPDSPSVQGLTVGIPKVR